MVAMPGRSPVKISVSGLALSSDRQNAISSATQPTTVYPRTARNDAVCTSRTIRLVKYSASRVRRSTSGASNGTPSSNPSM